MTVQESIELQKRLNDALQSTVKAFTITESRLQAFTESQKRISDALQRIHLPAHHQENPLKAFAESQKTISDALQRIALPVQPSWSSLRMLSEKMSVMQSAVFRLGDTGNLLKAIESACVADTGFCKSSLDGLLSSVADNLEAAEAYVPKEELQPVQDAVSSVKKRKDKLTKRDAFEAFYKIVSLIYMIICVITYIAPDEHPDTLIEQNAIVIALCQDAQELTDVIEQIIKDNEQIVDTDKGFCDNSNSNPKTEETEQNPGEEENLHDSLNEKEPFDSFKFQ